MREKPLLMVCTYNARVKDFICQSISNLIGHLVEIQGCSREEKFFASEVPDLILVSSSYAVKFAEESFPGVPIILADRVLTGINIEQVLAIPAGTKVVVFSNPKGVVLEMINLLIQAGLNHVIYEGYWPGKDLDLNQFDYAITPGMRYTCSHPFKHLIDLHERALSVRTFVQILVKLGLPLNYVDIFENRYFRLHIEACRRVVKELGHSRQLEHAQSMILDQIDEAIISAKQDGSFLFANRHAQRYFSLTEGLEIKGDLQRAILALDRAPLQETANVYGTVQQSQDVALNIDGESFLCRKNIIISDETQVFYAFRRLEQIQELARSARNKLYTQEFSARYTFRDIWGHHKQLRHNKVIAREFAKTEQTILLTGESGTGKELMAQAIHNASARADMPFVAINLAAIPQTLVESELFGYESGAFTGARKGGKSGLFEIANHGTIFLDEIGDAPLGVQVLLLRVLEERVITRVGGLHPMAVDVRIIAATNQPLRELIEAGKFRSDLYYRLNVLSIQTLPVREMKNEIISFLQFYFQQLSGEQKHFSEEAVRLLESYPWPGNFRELKNVVEYLNYTTSMEDTITPEMLPAYLLQELRHSSGESSGMLEELDTLLQEPLLLKILQLLQEASPKGVGRGYLMTALAQAGLPASEREVKRCLTTLNQRGWAHSGNTRQGTFLTGQGRELLETYDDILPR